MDWRGPFRSDPGRVSKKMSAKHGHRAVLFFTIMVDNDPKNEKTGNYSSLCRPDKTRSCFGCCPPIRPAGYDHLQHRDRIEGLLLRNTRDWKNNQTRTGFISGYSCWGLGLIDEKRGLAGCLLHPAQNNGRDFRDLTGYGEKCRRELCLEARDFTRLTRESADLVIGLAEGLDSFFYSSRQENPAFRLIGWGPVIIEKLRETEKGGLSREEYKKRWPLLDRDLKPERDAFFVEKLLERFGLAELSRLSFQAEYLAALDRFIAQNRRIMTPPYETSPYVHQLGLPSPFTRFLRSSLGYYRAAPNQAKILMEKSLEMISGL